MTKTMNYPEQSCGRAEIPAVLDTYILLFTVNLRLPYTKSTIGAQRNRLLFEVFTTGDGQATFRYLCSYA